MDKPCFEFRCKEADECLCCYNGKCMGSGFDASITCGCTSCIYNLVEDGQNVCRLKNQEQMPLEIQT